MVSRLLVTTALRVRIQTSLKNTKWATYAKEWPTHSSPTKKYKKVINITFTGKGSRDYSPDWNLSCLIGHEAIKNIQLS